MFPGVPGYSVSYIPCAVRCYTCVEVAQIFIIILSFFFFFPKKWLLSTLYYFFKLKKSVNVKVFFFLKRTSEIISQSLS